MSGRRWFYLAAAVLGGILPYVFLLGYFAEHGLDLVGFVGALFANRVSTGFAVDLVISSLVFWPFMWGEARRLGMGRRWAYVLLNLTVGLSLALPLFLFFRQGRLDAE